MNKAILVTSFGTSYEYALERSIAAIENDFAVEFPDCDVFRAFNCERIINILSKRGVKIDSMDEALKKILKAGYEEVIIQPTHLIGGVEYDKLCGIAKNYEGSFQQFKVGVPLLSSPEDIDKICRFFHKKFCGENRLLVLTGHGTKRTDCAEYADMNKMCAQLGYNDIFVSTVEAAAEIDDVLDRLRSLGSKKALLTPLMLTAGGHANKDMAGSQPDSWKSMLETAGIEVETIIKGVGEYPEIRSLYIEHLRKII